MRKQLSSSDAAGLVESKCRAITAITGPRAHTKRITPITLKGPMFRFAGVLLTMMACPAVALAAAETGNIAVLEFTLSNNVDIDRLDNCTERPEFQGTLKGWDGA